MKVSVIVPCYKVEKYLPECLDSVFSQRFEGMEVIGINDGSPDNCIGILRDYEARYPDIMKVVDQENRGISAARNAGINASTGEYICVLDSDDKFADNVIERAYNICIENDLEVLYARADAFHDSTSGTYENWYDDVSFIDGSLSEVLTGVEALNQMCNDKTYQAHTWLQTIKRSFLTENGIEYIEGTTFEAGPYSFEVFLKAKRLMIDNSIFIHYRLRDGSITHSAPTGVMVHDLLRTLLKKIDVYTECLEKGMNVDQNGVYWRLSMRRSFTALSYSQLDNEQRKVFSQLCSERERMYFRTFIRINAINIGTIKNLEATNEELFSERQELKKKNRRLKKKNQELKEENQSLKNDLKKAKAKNKKIKNSTAYKIGRIITAPFRKLKRLFSKKK